MDETRLERLEILAAEQERTIEEMSAQLAEQWREIERLRGRLDLLTRRFQALEEQAIPSAQVTKPPHW